MVSDILSFLSDLSFHNDRDWFQAHRCEYDLAHEAFMAFSTQYLERLSAVDDTLVGLSAKDCVWRIYRDTRFSKNKSPYKEWLGVFAAPKGGRKSLRAGYYMHFQPGQCLFAGGMWSPSPDLLKAVRREIEANYDEVEAIMAHPHFASYFSDFDTEDMLKRVPVGFDPDFVHADWLKRKSFTFSHPFTDEQVLAPDFMERVVDIATAAKPMNDFLNYTFEQYGEFSPRRC